MSAKESRNGSDADTIPEGGILAALPRTRPQRASARREAARASTVAKTSATTGIEAEPSGTADARTPAVTAKKPSPAKRPAQTKSKPANARGARVSPAKASASAELATPRKPTATAKRRAKPIAKPPEPPAPKQGYEPEEEVELGATVHPPSGAELVESVADILGELAGSSFAAGGRLLKDAMSLLRRP
ncbi:MAG TPA: hypothetical protein VN845_12730 [Solirubrobacteraceae bacterium]|nr:hypothetical protein [Solirubrobacteraceae bacterium]